jgi:alkanesulfonate monooxygenase
MEYALILRMLLRSAGPVTYEGKHYRITGRGLKRRLPASLMPRLMVSGSYEAGRIAARRLGATPIECPRPPAACEALPQFEADAGMRIGIVCRAHDEEAWSAALPRLAAPASASLQLERPPAGLPQLHSAAAGAARAPVRDCYWAAPFESGRARCPYLVGSYDRVAAALACYARTGHRTVILDLVSAEEIRHIGAALARARRFAATG